MGTASGLLRLAMIPIRFIACLVLVIRACTPKFQRFGTQASIVSRQFLYATLTSQL
jgi:hypothetical protein